MKMRFIAILFLVCILVGCMNTVTPPEDDTISKETGYRDGQVQQDMIYYSGVLWEIDFYNTELQHLIDLPERIYTCRNDCF